MRSSSSPLPWEREFAFLVARLSFISEIMK
jgi:hypothetical protein